MYLVYQTVLHVEGTENTDRTDYYIFTRNEQVIQCQDKRFAIPERKQYAHILIYGGGHKQYQLNKV